MGPYHSGSRPILANIQHRGGGSFCIEALSVDGTHQCDVYATKAGQFSIEDHKTEIMPGKEYMLENRGRRRVATETQRGLLKQ